MGDIDELSFVNDKMYLVNKQESFTSISNGTSTLYQKKFFTNGELKVFEYSSIENIPSYLIIDSVSGEISKYNKLNEVPESEKKFFKK